MARYGLHHENIKRFLSRVKAFTESDWAAVSAAGVLTSAAFGARPCRSLERDLEFHKEFGIPEAGKIIDQALNDAGITRGVAHTEAKEIAHRQLLVLDALIGLVHSADLSV